MEYLDINLKGHGNEADFLGFLQKLVPHRSLRLPFEPFRLRLRIRGDIRNRKKDSATRRVGESTTPRLGESASRLLNFYKKNPRVVESGRESPTLRLGESVSRRLPDSPTRGVDDSPTR